MLYKVFINTASVCNIVSTSELLDILKVFGILCLVAVKYWQKDILKCLLFIACQVLFCVHFKLWPLTGNNICYKCVDNKAISIDMANVYIFCVWYMFGVGISVGHHIRISDAH